MRALVITPTPTHPATQGNRVRVLQMASALKEGGAAVELLYIALDGLDTGGLETMRDMWDAVHIVSNEGFSPRRSFAAVWGLDDWIGPSVLEATRHLAATRHYDVVLVNYVWCSLLLTLFDRNETVRVLDTHDAFGDRHKLARSSNLDPHWFYTTIEEEAQRAGARRHGRRHPGRGRGLFFQDRRNPCSRDRICRRSRASCPRRTAVP